ncbi:protease propeptide/inhibitor [Obba rivulosa]|uniref:Protease propeptide/inhibitor n=1 Tax=Obba rivulosa TaxID=1052685 RepID=A0A8E2DSM1_9APHY|nr:protease propeptide/inhibitor [Obba rivulosa]
MSGRYIVVFKDSVTQDKIDQYANDVHSNGGQVSRKFTSLLKGFSAEIPETYLTQLKSFGEGDIDYIEPDSVVTTQ